MRQGRWLLAGVTLTAVLAAACSPARPTLSTTAGNSALEPVETWTEDRDAEGHLIMFRNNLRVPIRIIEIQLLGCQNTRPACGRIDPRLRLEPGQARDGLTVRPSTRTEGFSFHYTWRWIEDRPGQSAAAPAAAPARTPTGPEANRLLAETARGLGARFAGLRAGTDSIVLRVDETILLADVPVFVIDSAGRVLGRLPFFDAGITSGAAYLVSPTRLAGVEPGVSTLTLRVPATYWGNPGLPRPAVQIRVIVR